MASLQLRRRQVAGGNKRARESGRSSLLAFGFIIILIYLIYALVRGKVAGDNPWNSRGYEWMTTSPPPKHNFDHPVIIDRDSHDYQEPGEEVEHVVI